MMHIFNGWIDLFKCLIVVHTQMYSHFGGNLPAHDFCYFILLSTKKLLSNSQTWKPIEINSYTHHNIVLDHLYAVYGWMSLNIVIKHVFICSNPYIYTTVVQELYNRDPLQRLMMLRGWQRLLQNIGLTETKGWGRK